MLYGHTLSRQHHLGLISADTIIMRFSSDTLGAAGMAWETSENEL